MPCPIFCDDLESPLLKRENQPPCCSSVSSSSISSIGVSRASSTACTTSSASCTVGVSSMGSNAASPSGWSNASSSALSCSVDFFLRQKIIVNLSLYTTRPINLPSSILSLISTVASVPCSKSLSSFTGRKCSVRPICPASTITSRVELTCLRSKAST